MNLITNASQALGAEEGTITITTSVAEVDRAYLEQHDLTDDLAEGVYVCLEVTDTGHGMDAKVQESIFDPFFSTKPNGKGLGLAAVIGIIRAHRGAIAVTSSPGQGTAYRILLPASGKPVRSSVEAVSSAEFQGTGTFLVVDDEEIVRGVSMSMLAAVGFTVVGARDGHEALELARGASDELVGVMLDLTMPALSGHDVFRELRRLQPDLPVLLVSDYSQQEVSDLLAGDGLVEFVQKPFGPNVLVDRVRRLLEQAPHRP